MSALTPVHLYGALGSQFGKRYDFAVNSVGEAIAALRANFPAFADAIRHGHYRVVLGKNKTSGLAVTEEQAARVRLAGRPVHIIPAIKGRKRGMGKVIVGIALIALSVAAGPLAGLMATSIGMTTVGAMTATAGIGMVVGGVAQMISPELKAGDEKQSFTMSGPQSNLREGNIVPICYGEVVTGGYLISGAVEINGPTAGENKTIPLAETSPGGSAAWIGHGRKTED